MGYGSGRTLHAGCRGRGASGSPGGRRGPGKRNTVISGTRIAAACLFPIHASDVDELEASFVTLQVSFLESTLVAMEHEIADLRSRVMGGGANGHNGHGNGNNGNHGGERVMTRSSWR